METEAHKLTPEEEARYNRHLLIPGFGPKAQLLLKAASVLVVGCGGLGSPVLLYLAAAGVGRIGLVDFDAVEESNLQRQVLFDTPAIGKSKAGEAGSRLHALNPLIQLEVHPVRISAANAVELVEGYDVVVDGTDNFPTRYLVNDTCVRLGKPYVYGSIYQFEGQVSVFNQLLPDGQRGPNYRDLYPQPPEPGQVRSCAEGGVLGVLPGIIGSMQALEVIKLITGLGNTLSGRYFVFDALSFEGRTFRIPFHEENSLRTGAEVTHDWEVLVCAPPVAETPLKEITPEALAEALRSGTVQLIDVREPEEYERVNIGGWHMPLGRLDDFAGAINREGLVVVHCKTGARSAAAIRHLVENHGYTNLYNLKGGLLAYISSQRPDLGKYV